MIKIKDIFDFTESFAPLASQADFDNSGLLVGDMESKVTKVLLALDITQDAVSEAESLGAELIISHHPVIFAPIKSLGSGSIPYLLASKNIAALCLHTNLDRAEVCGVNLCLAKALELSDIALYPEDFLAIGSLGTSNAAPVKELAAFVKEKLSCEGVEYILGENKISKVAVSSGAGTDGFKRAKELGAQVLITGEAKHHELLEAHSIGIPVIIAGHFHTEDVVITPLCETLSKKFPEITFKKSEKYRWISHKI